MKYVKNRKSRLNTLPTATLLAGKANLSGTEARTKWKFPVGMQLQNHMYSSLDTVEVDEQSLEILHHAAIKTSQTYSGRVLNL